MTHVHAARRLWTVANLVAEALAAVAIVAGGMALIGLATLL